MSEVSIDNSNYFLPYLGVKRGHLLVHKATGGTKKPYRVQNRDTGHQICLQNQNTGLLSLYFSMVYVVKFVQ